MSAFCRLIRHGQAGRAARCPLRRRARLPNRRRTSLKRLAGYLLLSVLVTINPPGFVNHQQAESFVLQETIDSLQSLEAEQKDVLNINDFAFVSLTSVDYGDIVPVRPSTKLASMGLSVAGPFYISAVMVVLISRLFQMEEPPPRGWRDR